MPRRESQINTDDRGLKILQQSGHNRRRTYQNPEYRCAQCQRPPGIGTYIQCGYVQYRYGKLQCDGEMHKQRVHRYPKRMSW